MALSIIRQPYQGEPLNGMDNSTIYLIADSDLSYNTDFNYQIQTIINYPFGYPSYNYRVPPRPSTGYGQFAASDILKSFVSYDLNPTITSIQVATNSWVNYSFNITECFNPLATYYDTFDYAGYVGLTAMSVSGLFHQGDTITIQGDNPILAPEYNGEWQVISTSYDNGDLDANAVVLDLPFTTSTPTGSGGQITYCILSSQALSTTDFDAFNSTRQYNNLQTTDFSNKYYIDGPSKNFLTGWDNILYSAPSSSNSWKFKKVFSTDKETLSFNIATASSVVAARYTFYDKNFNVAFSTDKYTPSGGTSYKRSYDIPCGPANMGVSLTGIKYYSIYIWNSSSGLQYTYNQAFEIVENCSPYTNVRIAYMNSYGRFDYFNFNYVSKNTFNVESRDEFRKTLPWNYVMGDRGNTVLSQSVNESFYLSSDWISENESSILKELSYSPEVYILDDAYNKIPVIITDTSYEVKTNLKDRLFCMTLNVKMAYNKTTQNQ